MRGDNNYKCGHCGYDGPCYGNGFSAPWCRRCERNDKLVKKDMKNPIKMSELSDKLRVDARKLGEFGEKNTIANNVYAAANRIDELETHLERVLGWQETTEMIAPELGGLIKEMNVARTLFSKQPQQTNVPRTEK